MNSSLTIRAESERDHVVVGNIIRAAFEGKPYAAGDEAELVEALRAVGDLSVSLVAELNGVVVGQIALSPAQPSDGSSHWYALGPVAVLPSHQGARIGSQLVLASLQVITELGANGCILEGDPAYYVRFGFELSPSNAPAPESSRFFMAKVLRGQLPNGPIAFHPAFNTAEHP